MCVPPSVSRDTSCFTRCLPRQHSYWLVLTLPLDVFPHRQLSSWTESCLPCLSVFIFCPCSSSMTCSAVCVFPLHFTYLYLFSECRTLSIFSPLQVHLQCLLVCPCPLASFHTHSTSVERIYMRVKKSQLDNQHDTPGNMARIEHRPNWAEIKLMFKFECCLCQCPQRTMMILSEGDDLTRSPL